MFHAANVFIIAAMHVKQHLKFQSSIIGMVMTGITTYAKGHLDAIVALLSLLEKKQGLELEVMWAFQRLSGH